MRCPSLAELPHPPVNKLGWPWTEESPQLPNKISDGSQWPKISIVTPSYNQGEFIEETIRSVLLQGYPNLEYIIIDGGSTDQSVEIIKKYEQWLTYWISEPDRGQSNAINKGLAKCSGDIFNWLNSDDFLAKNSLESIGESFDRENTEIISGYRRRFYNETNETEAIGRMTITPCLEEAFSQQAFFQVPTFYNFNKLKEIGFLDERLNYVMDWELWIRYRLISNPNRIKLIDKLIGNYRFHEASKTVGKKDPFIDERILLMEKLLRYTLHSPVNPDELSNDDPERNFALVWHSSQNKINKRALAGYLYQTLASLKMHQGKIGLFEKIKILLLSMFFKPIKKPNEYRFLVGTLFPHLGSLYRNSIKRFVS